MDDRIWVADRRLAAMDHDDRRAAISFPDGHAPVLVLFTGM